MTIDIQKPELEALIYERMESWGLNSVEDVLLRALQPANFGNPSDGPSGAEVIAAMQSSPFKEIDLETPRVRVLAREPVTFE